MLPIYRNVKNVQGQHSDCSESKRRHVGASA